MFPNSTLFFEFKPSLSARLKVVQIYFMRAFVWIRTSGRPANLAKNIHVSAECAQKPSRITINFLLCNISREKERLGDFYS